MEPFLTARGIRYSQAQEDRGGSVLPSEVIPHLLEVIQRLVTVQSKRPQNKANKAKQTRPTAVIMPVPRLGTAESPAATSGPIADED